MKYIDVEAVLRGEVGDWKTRAMIKKLPQSALEKMEFTLRAENFALMEWVELNGREPSDRERLKVCRGVALELNGISRAQLKSMIKAPAEAIRSLLKRQPQHGDTNQEQDNKDSVPK